MRGSIMFSVIIPTFNRPLELQRCIDSIISQTYGHFEILVINDYGCTQQFEKIANLYCDPRIKFITNTRSKGANGARNTGIDLSNNRYLLFLDDDNYFLKDRLMKLSEVISKQYNNRLFLTEYFVEHDGKRTHSYIQERPTLGSYLRGKNLLNAGSNIVIKVNDQKSVLYWNEDLKRHQDTEYILRLLAMAECYVVKEALFVSTGHNGIPQAEKLALAKEKLIEVLSRHAEVSAHPDFKFFMAKQYRDLCCAYLCENMRNHAVSNLRHSLSIKILPLYLYLRPIYYFMKTLLK